MSDLEILNFEVLYYSHAQCVLTKPRLLGSDSKRQQA